MEWQLKGNIMAKKFLVDSSEESLISQIIEKERPKSEPIRHLLIGSPRAVRRTIHRLHQLGYAEAGAWSRLLPTANPGEVMSILVRYLRSQD